MRALEEKVAIITGASSGIGRAAARLFAREGAKLVLNARGKPALDALIDELASQGATAIAFAGDVQQETVARGLVACAVEHFGGLDVAFNNAGSLGPGTQTVETSLKDWEDTLRTNLTSAFLAAKAQLPALLARGSGSLIFTSTFVGHTVGMPGMAPYAASKAGLVGLVQTLAAEVGPRGIRVNALLSGGTDTPLGRSFMTTPEVRTFVEGLHALKRIAEPEEIARAALFLASDASSFVTGTAMLVDGGVSINRT